MVDRPPGTWDVRYFAALKAAAERAAAAAGRTLRVGAEVWTVVGEDRTSARLLGRQVLAVVNFPPRQIATFFSEVLVLGVPDADGNVVLLEPQAEVPLGGRLF